MLIGVPKEIKDNEFRVGLTPSSVAELTQSGHKVLVQTAAGIGSGLTDDEYVAAGVHHRQQPGRDLRTRRHDREGEGAACVGAHDAAAAGRSSSPISTSHPTCSRPGSLIASQATCIAYETVTSPSGGLPLLTPMSEVAGRLAPQVGAHCLEKEPGGRGVLLGGVPGVPAADVVDPRRRRVGHPCGHHRARHGRQRHRGRPQPGSAAPPRDFSSAPACGRSSPPARQSTRSSSARTS